MKKIEFALQVFVLTAMLPLYIISELNRGSTKLPAEKITPVENQLHEKTVIKTTENTTAEFKNANAVTVNLKGL
ncbi:hypothetical protein BH11BAC5_BH11BAC5_07640 [soil metagenome]